MRNSFHSAVLILAMLTGGVTADRCAAAEKPWLGSLEKALNASEKSGFPILVLIRDERNLASLDAGHWLERNLDLLSPRFHMIRIWRYRSETAQLPYAPKSGLLFINSKKEIIAIAKVPLLFAQLRPLLWRILKNPESLQTLQKKALSKGSPALVRLTVERLAGSGFADRALALLDDLTKRPSSGKVRTPSGPSYSTEEMEAMRVQASMHLWKRWKALHAILRNNPESFAPGKRNPSLSGQAYLGSLWLRPDSSLKAALGLPTQGQSSNKMDSEKALELVNKKMDSLQGVAQELQWNFLSKYPHLLSSRLNRLRNLIVRAERGERVGGELEKQVQWMLGRRLGQEGWLNAAKLVSRAAILAHSEELQERVARELDREALKGRDAAEALHWLAEAAYLKGDHGRARKRYDWALDLAVDESPVLERTSKLQLSILSGKFTSLRSAWGNRKAFDVVVLVEDWQSYAAALGAWTEKIYFPVLFKDDHFAPKFIEKFKPANVISIAFGQNTDAGLSAQEVRSVIASSWQDEPWKPDNRRQGAQALAKERLRKIKTAASGVVFWDGRSSTIAGGLALAAGRFQGLEIIEGPQPNEIRSENSQKRVSRMGANRIAQNIRTGLRRWPSLGRGHWRAVTLAVDWPVLSGAPNRNGLIALDDLLGRSEDSVRVASVGRLIGGRIGSAYQAMCSLFLKVDQGLTVDALPKVNLQAIMFETLSSTLQKQISLTHLLNGSATLKAFMDATSPWNSKELIFLAAAGADSSWSLSGTLATSEELPVGSPYLLRMIHPAFARSALSSDSLVNRALWGGAFWIQGAVSDPYRSAFQNTAYLGPLLSKGVSLGAACVRPTGQRFSWPWRIVNFGDPLFCLREKNVDRKEYRRKDGYLVAKAETYLLEEGQVSGRSSMGSSQPDSWIRALRHARWCGLPKRIEVLLRNRPKTSFSSQQLGWILEELVKRGDFEEAGKLLLSEDRSGKNQPWAVQIYGRRVLSHLLGKAIENRKLPRAILLMERLLVSGPCEAYAERWLEAVEKLAGSMNNTSAFEQWLQTAGLDQRLAPFHNLLQKPPSK